MTQKPSTTLNNQFLSKVPEITIFFWIIKVLCTTVGETASDFLNVNLNLGLIGTSIAMGLFLLIVLFFQFKSKKYVPFIYWLAVVLVSVFGTLVTDIMTDNLKIPLEVSTIFFSVLLGITFFIWYMKEKTLSIHSIFTRQRELFYWLAILFTFALGTATGDLMAESLGLGYFATGMIVVSVVTIFSIAWKIGLNSILSFWIIYIMTRPLGASLGDYLSQPLKYGGLGLGATLTSAVFVIAIVLTVLFLSISKRDTVIKKEAPRKESGGILQTIIVLFLCVIISGIGYFWCQNRLKSEIQTTTSQTNISLSGVVDTGGGKISLLGDLSVFKNITQDMLNFVNSGNMTQATARASDLEYEWDNAEARLKPMSQIKWTETDSAIDKVLRQLRAVNPNPETSKAALEILLKVLN